MHVSLARLGLFKLFQQIGHLIRQTKESDLVLDKVVCAVGQHFGLDRCLAFVLDDDLEELALVAEYHEQSTAALGSCRYLVRHGSKWHQLLSEGRPLPLKDIVTNSNEATLSPEVGRLIEESGSKSLVAFPMVCDGKLVGCLSMHYLWESKVFSDDILEFGELVAQELAQGLVHARNMQRQEAESEAFRDAGLPMLVLDFRSQRIVLANDAAVQLLDSTGNGLTGLLFSNFLGGSDGERLASSVVAIGSGKMMVALPALVVRSAQEGALCMDLCVSALKPGFKPHLLIVFLPSSDNANALCERESSRQGSQVSKVEELVSTLTRQLNWERSARQIVTSLASSFDHDVILQMAVDALGRALNVTRALIVKVQGLSSPQVTHEFTVAEISPLGLGRTSQFPLTAVNCFKTKSTSFADLSRETRSPEMSSSDLKYFLDMGIAALAGCPVIHHGQNHGLIIVLESDKKRNWTVQEIDLLEIVSDQVAIALNHASAYALLKDELFNRNLLSNLTQQLTNVLDLTAYQSKAGALPDKTNLVCAEPPLSPRELEVLKLIATGLANREIAKQLFLTESTVELHASRIRKKLKLKSRTALVKYACDNHLV